MPNSIDKELLLIYLIAQEDFRGRGGGWVGWLENEFPKKTPSPKIGLEGLPTLPIFPQHTKSVSCYWP